MHVLVVRHAIALDRGEANQLGVLDADRPLTKDGRRRMKRVARGLCARVPDVSALLCSPWRRAVETADLLRERYESLQTVETDALLPDAQPEALAQSLEAMPAASCVAVVGHEPHLSRWVSWCLTGRCLTDRGSPIVELRKGGACLLRFEDTVGSSRGQLLWLMTPSILRRL